MVDTISLRKWAKKANVSQTAPYRHFQSKDYLIIEVCLKGLSNLREKIELSIQKILNPEQLMELWYLLNLV